MLKRFWWRITKTACEKPSGKMCCILFFFSLSLSLSLYFLSFVFSFCFFVFYFLFLVHIFFFFSQFFILCNLYLKAKSCVTIFVHVTFLEFEFIVMKNCTLIVSLKKSNEKKKLTKQKCLFPCHYTITKLKEIGC